MTVASVSCSVSEDKNQIAVTPQEHVEAGDKLQVKPLENFTPEQTKKVVSSIGFESVTFGMTESEANAKFSGGLERPKHLSVPEFWEEEKNCYYLYPKNSESTETFEFGLMVESGVIQRIDVGSPNIVTERGAKIGMSFMDIEKLYSKTERKPNFYTYPFEDLIITLDEDTKIIFEQSGDEIVSNYRLGKVPAVEFVEGCL